MWKLFVKLVAAPALGAALFWWVGEQLPRPTNWDLLCYPPAYLLGSVAVVGAIIWIAKVIAVRFFRQGIPEREDLTSTATSLQMGRGLDPERACQGQVKLEYRTINPSWCKGEPPGKAVVPDRAITFDLDWGQDGLMIKHDGAILNIQTFSGDGAPGATLVMNAEGDRVHAPLLSYLTTGMRTLRLEAKGDVLESKLNVTMSAGHGSIESWVRFTIHPTERLAKIEVFSEFDDCR